MKELQAPMVISQDATLYDVLPALYDFVQAHIGHYAPTESFEDAASRVEYEALQKLITAIDLLIAISPAINGK